MDNLLQIYQNTPASINPNIHLGLFSVSWYSVMYLVAFGVVYSLIRYRIAKGEWDRENQEFKTISQDGKKNKLIATSYLEDFLLYSFLGLILGARLGEVLFYNFSYYFSNPSAIISPFDPVTGEFMGIYGMSYHGGLIGVLIAAWVWAKKNNICFLDWANFVVPAVPAGYIFGRIGNFINGELYGRATGNFWGMYFPADQSGILRHPSQIYEAILEGVVLFLLFWPMRNRTFVRNNFLALYLLGYALARIIAEFFREPDGLLWGLTLGQIYSLPMAGVAIFLFLKKRKNWYNEKKEKQKTI